MGNIEACSIGVPSQAAAINALGMASTMGSPVFFPQAWLSPLHGLSLLQSGKKPSPFTGREAGDWQRFAIEWRPNEKMLEQAYPMGY